MPELPMNGEYVLVASVAALFVGPLIYRFAGRDGRAYSLFDGMVVVAVLGLALLEIVPLGVELAGWPALLAMVAGVLLPNLAERRFGGKSTHRVATWAALIGTALHAFTDGLALAVGGHVHAGSHAMEWAVVLHRVPEGLAVWWMLTSPDDGDESGQRAGILALVTIATATGLGYLFAGSTTVLDDSRVVGVFAAFVGGLLLHVVSHGIGSTRSRRAAEHRYWPGIGGLLGLALVVAVVVVPATRDGHGAEIVDAFWDLLLESAPALLLAYGVAGLIGSVMGEAPARWLRRGGATMQSLRGVVFGLPLPLCSCGVVPVYRSLVDRRVPATAALAFLVATPELGLDAVLLSVPLLGLDMALLRVGVAFVLALFVGVVVGGWVERRELRARGVDAGGAGGADGASEPEPPPPDTRPLRERLVAGLHTGYGSILDSTGPWILVGLLLAAFLQPWVDAEFFTQLGPMLQVVAFGLLGLPVYVCATGATPLVAVLIAKGLSPGAALAFLLTGPATNATTFGVLEQLHGRKVALAFAGAMIVAVLGLGWGVNLVWPAAGAEAAVAHVHDSHGVLAIASAGVLGVLFLASLVRQGPRGFLGRLWELGGHDHDHHDHGDHDHDDHDDHDDGDHGPGKDEPKAAGGCCGGH
ncbi:Transporter [Enhygromyxa salina]|uniref:Transporter n=1 Tax=Enhygromyxa salina TaxID=215803 RepID=A0A0C2CU66_9BACT|nr:permease [Enhygromyxa salina]KIG13155.1 Transporter [Enhygromyxa salina]